MLHGKNDLKCINYESARGLLMVKTVNKYTLNSLVSDLFCDIQRM